MRWYDEEKEEEEFHAPTTFNNYVLTLNSRPFKGHLSALGTELTKLVQEMASDTLLFRGDNELPWLNQINEYKPVKEAQQYLIQKKIGKRFNGGLQVNLLELPTFIKHLGWLISVMPHFLTFTLLTPDKTFWETFASMATFIYSH